MLLTVMLWSFKKHKLHTWKTKTCDNEPQILTLLEETWSLSFMINSLCQEVNLKNVSLFKTLLTNILTFRTHNQWSLVFIDFLKFKRYIFGKLKLISSLVFVESSLWQNAHVWSCGSFSTGWVCILLPSSVIFSLFPPGDYKQEFWLATQGQCHGE